MLTNPGQAAALVTGAAKIALHAVGHRNDVQQRVRQLERLIGKENISPQQLQAYQAELAQPKTLLGEINGVIQNAKDKVEETCDSDCVPDFIPEDALAKVPTR